MKPLAIQIVFFMSLFFLAYQNCADGGIKKKSDGKSYSEILDDIQEDVGEDSELQNFATDGKDKSPTFRDIDAEISGNSVPDLPTQVDQLPSKSLLIKVDLVPKCNVGEVDILKMAKACNLAKPLLITIKGDSGENVVFKIRLNNPQSLDQFVEALDRLRGAEIIGNEVDLFVCIDGNENDSCMDEAISDINPITERLIKFTGLFGPNKDYVCNSQELEDFANELATGRVFFHISRVFEGADEPVSQARQVASAEVNDILKNVAVVVNTDDAAANENFNIPMVNYDKAACPKPKVRTNGCFAKGTMIKVGEKVSVPVEDIRTGHQILLADGRTGVVKRTIAGPELEPIIVLKSESGKEIKITSTHPMMTSNGVKMAKDIGLNDELILDGDTKESIKSISREVYNGEVYNVELAGVMQMDHLIVANGLVSGDLYLQNKLSRSDSKSLFAKLISYFW